MFLWKLNLVLVKSEFRTGQQWLVVKRVIVNTDCTKGHCEHWLLTSSEKSVSPNTDFLVKSVSPNTDFLVKSESTNSESLTCGRVTFLPCKNVTLQSYFQIWPSLSTRLSKFLHQIFKYSNMTEPINEAE